MAEYLGESRTFSEYLLIPSITSADCIPSNVNLETPLVKYRPADGTSLSLKIPLVSAAMQAVSDSKMAVSLARQGGLSFIYCSQSIDQQVAMVKAVKSHKAGFVTSDSNVRPMSTIDEVVALTKKTGHSSVAVTDDGSASGRLLGLITDKDYRPSRISPQDPVAKYMTRFEDLVCGNAGLSIEEANDLIWKNKINCLPIIDGQQNLVALVFRRDYEDHKRNPLQLVDRDKRLLVGAAINTWDYRHRVKALLDAGVDVLCVDASDGYSEWQRDAIRFIKGHYGDGVKVGGGNVVHSDGFKYLVDSGADFIKVGIGGGAICITREQKGIGRGQASAILEVGTVRDKYCDDTGIYVPLCSDGGISQDYHIGIALAFGADFVMMGRYFAGFDESPGSLVKLGTKTVKEYWGEGTHRANNWERYAEGPRRELAFEEGADAYVPYMGKLSENVQGTLSKLRSLMCNCGSISIGEFRRNARYVVASETTIREGGVHDVIVKSFQSNS